MPYYNPRRYLVLPPATCGQGNFLGACASSMRLGIAGRHNKLSTVAWFSRRWLWRVAWLFQPAAPGTIQWESKRWGGGELSFQFRFIFDEWLFRGLSISTEKYSPSHFQWATQSLRRVAKRKLMPCSFTCDFFSRRRVFQGCRRYGLQSVVVIQAETTR